MKQQWLDKKHTKENLKNYNKKKKQDLNDIDR